jgi:hypothetical protein
VATELVSAEAAPLSKVGTSLALSQAVKPNAATIATPNILYNDFMMNSFRD